MSSNSKSVGDLITVALIDLDEKPQSNLRKDSSEEGVEEDYRAFHEELNKLKLYRYEERAEREI